MTVNSAGPIGAHAANIFDRAFFVRIDRSKTDADLDRDNRGGSCEEGKTRSFNSANLPTGAKRLDFDYLRKHCSDTKALFLATSEAPPRFSSTVSVKADGGWNLPPMATILSRAWPAPGMVLTTPVHAVRAESLE